MRKTPQEKRHSKFKEDKKRTIVSSR